MDKMKMELSEITSQNIDKIAALFPNCVTEISDGNGGIRRAVNFDILRQMLSDEVIHGAEAYEFTWVGKKAAIVEANKSVRKTLRPCPEESVNWDSTQNLYIEGDNLNVLKLLQESYHRKVHIIYIDPPYNTGHDFIYPDSFIMNNDEYNEGTYRINEDGKVNFKRENAASTARYHSDWCSMMYSRLILASNLLSDDGVIFISIDDHEQENLKKMCDEVFGQDNFITKFIWEKTQHFGRQKINYYSNCEYVYCYAKNLTSDKGIKELLVEYVKTDFMDAPLFNASNPENEILFPAGSTQFRIPDGVYHSSDDVKFTLLDDVTVKDGKNVNDFRLRFRSRWSPSKVIQEWKIGTTFLIKSRNFSVRTVYADGKRFNESPRQLIFTNSSNSLVTKNRYGVKVGTNEEGTAELENLKISGFSYPKPVSLLTYLLSLYQDNDVTVLDFFSGSATTAHAVMQLNADDSGKRKFIMVQVQETIDDNSNGYKTICDIGKERIRRAGAKIKERNPQNAAELDIGFRVFKLDESNMKDVYYTPDELDQQMLLDMESNIKEDRTDLDLLFGCLLEWGLPLSLSYTSEQIEGCTIHTYNDGDLIACFDEDIPDGVIKSIAKRQPLRAVFRDSSFSGSPAKINVGEIFKMLAPDTRVKVI